PLLARNLVPRVLPIRIAQRRRLRDHRPHRRLLITRRRRNKHILPRLPRKKRNIPLHIRRHIRNKVHHRVPRSLHPRQRRRHRRLIGNIRPQRPRPRTPTSPPLPLPPPSPRSNTPNSPPRHTASRAAAAEIFPVPPMNKTRMCTPLPALAPHRGSGILRASTAPFDPTSTPTSSPPAATGTPTF